MRSVFRLWMMAGGLAVLILFAAGVAPLAPVAFAQDPANLIKQLGSANQAARLAALDALGKLAAKPATARAAIEKSLAHSDPVTRARAAHTLAAFGVRAKESVAAVMKMLSGDADPLARAAAARCLGSIGDKQGPEVDALLQAITDKDPRVRRAAVASVRQLAPGPDRTLPKFVQVLEDADPGAVVAALVTISDFGAAAVPPMINALANPKSRYWALLVLNDIGPAAKDAAKPIEALLSDEQPEMRLQAALALGAIGPDAEGAASALIATAKDEQAGVRYAVAYALGRLGDPAAKDALAELQSADDPMQKMLATWALSQIEPENAELRKQSLAALSEGISSPDAMVRRAAAHGLGDEKLPADEVVPLLIKALADKESSVAQTAAEALLRFGAAAVEPLAHELANAEQRPEASFLLSRMGEAAQPACGALLDAFQAETDPEVQRLTLLALAAAGCRDAAAVPVLVKALRSEQPRVQRSATYVLGKMGPVAKSALANIQGNLNSDDPDLRLVSVWACLQIAPQDKTLVAQAVPQLIKALRHELDQARIEAATALGNLGAAAQTALPALREMLTYEGPAVRAAVEEAIKKIEGAGKK
ncbi:MAG: HEAT repeat domain-containing protein [Pirellulales bacterium]|nr:HEAT repeat domain-containing protein [Pirellulales bacterium]